MMGRWKLVIVMAAAVVLPLGLAACDGGGDDGTTPQDTAAPFVLEIHPHDGETGVGLDDEIMIVFSEAMEPGSAAGQVALSHGGAVLDWQSPDTLVVGHGVWPEGAEVTCTVGAGLTDAAGNPLLAARTASFWTWSAQPRFLASEPDSGAVGVPTNTTLRLLFTHPMDPFSLAAAMTVAPGAPDFDVDRLDWNTVLVTFDAPLAASTQYTVTIGAGALTDEMTPRPLAAPATIVFTTGATSDTTPPYVVTTSPARNATGVHPAVAAATIQFSEPIDTDQFYATRVAGQAFVWIAGEPVWSAGNTIVTLPFRTPLPAGVRMFAIFGPGTFRDAVGNANTVADSLAFTVTGVADHLPLVNDAWAMFERTSAESVPLRADWADTIWVRNENVEVNGRFDRVRYNGSLGGEVDDIMHFQLTSQALQLRGFYNWDASADIWLSPVVDFITLPFAVGDWSGSTSADGVTLEYDGHILGRENLPLETGEDNPPLVLEGCWKVVLNHAMIAGGFTTETGADTLWAADRVVLASRAALRAYRLPRQEVCAPAAGYNRPASR